MSNENKFVISATTPAQFPPAELPEIAFAGRSNVGKSSLLNKLVGQHKLARTSNTPGRTRAINWFEVTGPKKNRYGFVDLPGYGYAKVSKGLRAEWGELIESYLLERQTLRLVLVLIDIRRGGSDEEIDFIAWLGQQEIPAHVLLTKADKLAKNKRKTAAFAAKKRLKSKRTPTFISTVTADGIEETWRVIQRAGAQQ